MNDPSEEINQKRIRRISRRETTNSVGKLRGILHKMKDQRLYQLQKDRVELVPKIQQKWRVFVLSGDSGGGENW